MATSPGARMFLDAPVLFQDVGKAEIAYRVIGKGPPLLFLHGWPLSGFTFRHLLPRLTPHFTCYLPDTPGAGDTRWSEGNDFSFSGHVSGYARFVDALGLASLAVLAHDTGATIARELALRVPSRIKKLLLIGTEIPGHRPPFIELFQTTTKLPGAKLSFRMLLQSRTFLRSKMGFGGCFEDPSLLEGEFAEHFVAPLVREPRRLEGQLRYLQGIDWRLVDSLAERHREIEAHVTLVWGEHDVTFPPDRARAMVAQFKRCDGLHIVPGARLLVHEEKPDAVVERALAFLPDA